MTQPFRLLKGSEVLALQGRVDEASRSWSERWGFAREKLCFTAGLSEATSASPPGGLCYVVENRDAIVGYIAFAARQCRHLLGSLLGQSAVSSGSEVTPMLREFAARSLTDWIGLLLGGPAMEEGALRVREVGLLPAGMSHAGSGTARIVITNGAESLAALALPLQTLSRLGVLQSSKGRSPSGGLVRRAVATAPARLRVDASLSTASLTIAELRGLNVGDVIVLEQSLAQALSVTLGKGQVAGVAYPGVRDGRLAVELHRTSKN